MVPDILNERAVQIYPMVPLAKASAVLKISRDELISRLSSGELLGEKRRIGESKKDSWFIYANEFDRLLAQAVAAYEERVSTKGLEQFFSQSETPLSPPVVAYAPPAVVAETLAETVTIDPIAVDHSQTDQAEIVDAMGTNYTAENDYSTLANLALDAGASKKAGSDYNLSTTEGTGLHIGQAMVAQLMQYLDEESRSAEALKNRLVLLEDEVELLRRELLSRPDKPSHSPFQRLKSYFRLLFR